MSHRYRVAIDRVKSSVLHGNPLGDPCERDLYLLVPEEFDAGRKLPVVWCFAGFSSVGKMFLQDDPWAEGLRERAERLSREGKLGATLFVLPDCFTRYGGSQYLNSLATGRYEDYLWKELLAHVAARYPCGRHGLVGRSSGGYAALVQGMRHPEIVSAVAAHSADSGFEYCYLADFPKFLDSVRASGGLESFLRAFDAAPKKRDGRFLTAMDVLAMAAAYSPNPDSPTLGVDFPFDLHTGELRPEVWRRWLDLDPVRMVETHADALRRLRLLFLDCGTRDEFHLLYGARMIVSKLKAAGVSHVHEEFDDGHMGVSYRYDRSLPLLWKALAE